MAAASTIVVFSSPPQSAIAFTPPPAGMSSSPSLPSPSQLFSSMPFRPPNGSGALTVPKDAVAGYPRASSLLRQPRSSGEDGSLSSVQRLSLGGKSGLQDGNKRPVKAKKTKAKTLKDEVGEGKKKDLAMQIKVPTFKEPKILHEGKFALSQEDSPVFEPSVTVGPKDTETPGPKKARKKKTKDLSEGQMKIKMTKITKPGKSKKGGSSTKIPNEPIAELPIGTQAEDAQAREEFRELCLEKAIPKRKEWTPVKDTIRSHINMDAYEKSTAAVSSSDTSTTLPTADLSKLLGDFGYAQKDVGEATSFTSSHQVDGEAIVKRRKIELVKGVGAALLVEKPKRNISPKKKAQTVTAKATAPFVPVEALATPSLLQYFGTPISGSEAEMHGGHYDIETPVTERRMSLPKKTAKSKIATSRAKKRMHPALLSPESAMKNARDQELLFGTSSQLAREDSPTFLKDIQQALKESESVEDDWVPSQVPVAKFKPYNSLALKRSKDLWSVGSRGFDGTLLNAEVVDLSKTTQARNKVTSSLATPERPGHPESKQTQAENKAPASAVACNPFPAELEHITLPVLQQPIEEPNMAMPKSVAEAALKQRPKNRAPIQKTCGPPKAAPDQMPNYKGYTDAQLTKVVASYGFKSLKKREAMIVLLERCWEGKALMAQQEVPANAIMSKALTDDTLDEPDRRSNPVKKKGRPSKRAAAKAEKVDAMDGTNSKKPRGRPRKDTTATTASPKRKRRADPPTGPHDEAAALAADEIYDSSPPNPSPPRRRPKSPGQPPLNLSNGNSSKSDIAVDKARRARLFDSMNRAVTTFAPTNDPKNLTFHEKMLLYEPVVLEDLAVWLNTEGLGRVGEDDEVEPLLVKAWCEERSVCCFWRENLRGGARSRW